jgi:hypothetical protein
VMEFAQMAGRCRHLMLVYRVKNHFQENLESEQIYIK